LLAKSHSSPERQKGLASGWHVRWRRTARQWRAATRDPRQAPGHSTEFAAAALFLCSEPAAYITGTTLVVDGGATRSV